MKFPLTTLVTLHNKNNEKKLLNDFKKLIEIGFDINEQDDEDLKKSFQVNVHSLFQIIKEMKNLLKSGSSISKEDSSVVNIGSIYGLVSPDYLIYKKAKFVNPISYGCIRLNKPVPTKK